MRASLEQLADDLQSVLDGSLNAEEFRTRHPIRGETGAFVEVLCLVQHYLDDADIRRRDSEYRAMQDAEMEKLISTLRSGRLSDAAKIHFLGYSE
jgi:hypothetical protein